MFTNRKKIVGTSESLVDCSISFKVNGVQHTVKTFADIANQLIQEWGSIADQNGVDRFPEKVRDYTQTVATCLDFRAEVMTPTLMEIAYFEVRAVARYLAKDFKLISLSDIQPLDRNSENFIDFDRCDINIESMSKEKKAGLIHQLVALPLAGGIASTMKMTCSKVKLSVDSSGTTIGKLKQLQAQYLTALMKDDEQFSDAGIAVMPFVSDVTIHDVRAVYDDLLSQGAEVEYLFQTQKPRINDAGFPADQSVAANVYPGGHGAILPILYANRVKLQAMLDQGRKYIVISNIDNYHGSNSDFLLKLLEILNRTDTQAAMIVTDPTQADVKGGKVGTVINTSGNAYSNQVNLVEGGQVDAEAKAALFNDKRAVDMHYPMNTNVIVYDIAFLLSYFDRVGCPDLPLIANAKSQGMQVETAIGSFNPPEMKAVLINRKYFGPVKTWADQFVRESLDQFNPDTGDVDIHPERIQAYRAGKVQDLNPLAYLDAKFYDTQEKYRELVRRVPNLSEANYIKVVGKVRFDNPHLHIVDSVEIESRLDLPVSTSGHITLTNKKVLITSEGKVFLQDIRRNDLNEVSYASELVETTDYHLKVLPGHLGYQLVHGKVSNTSVKASS